MEDAQNFSPPAIIVNDSVDAEYQECTGRLEKACLYPVGGVKMQIVIQFKSLFQE